MTIRTRSLPVLAAAAACVLTLSGGAAAAAPRAAPPDGPRDLRADLDLLAGEPDALAAIAEVRRGGQVWRAASGPARLGGARPAPVAGRFRAGSVTKTFTAVVVVQLAAEGRLRLADTVERRLPGLVPGGASITVEDLLRHTSGLPDYTEATGTDPESLLATRYRTWTPRELVELAVRRPPGPAVPGTFAYSNTNYVLLGMVVERVTGRSYRDEVSDRVLRPLRLRDTVLPGRTTGLRGPHAHGYLQVVRAGRTVDVDVTRLNPTVAGAAGELVSTTADLNRFYAALLTGDLLPAAGREAMLTVPRGSGYGMGVEVGRLSCGPAYGHGGGIPGFLTLSFATADAGRQATVSVTSRREVGWTPALLRRAFTLLDHALCGPEGAPPGGRPGWSPGTSGVTAPVQIVGRVSHRRGRALA